MNHAMNRRAFTLVEMLVVISAGSVLLVLAMSLVQRTMRAEMTAKTQLDVERTAARLAHQFRDDVHRAESVLIDRFANEEVGLRLTLNEQQAVAYRIERHDVELHDTEHSDAKLLKIVREEHSEENQTRREVYQFPKDYSLQFAELEAPRRSVLTLQRNAHLAGVPPQTVLHVATVVSQFRKLQTAEEASP